MAAYDVGDDAEGARRRLHDFSGMSRRSQTNGEIQPISDDDEALST